MSHARRTLLTSLGLILLRRRLQRQSGPAAALTLLGLELVGPRILSGRRLFAWALALTVVGGIAAVAIWWWWRRSSKHAVSGEPTPAATPQATPDAAPGAA
jgi:hypothetical protein